MSDFSIQLLTIELVIPHAQSLKDKRRVLRGVKDRLRKRFNVAVAEVAYQDKWQRAVLAITMLVGDARDMNGVEDSSVDIIVFLLQ